MKAFAASLTILWTTALTAAQLVDEEDITSSVVPDHGNSGYTYRSFLDALSNSLCWSNNDTDDQRVTPFFVASMNSDGKAIVKVRPSNYSYDYEVPFYYLSSMLTNPSYRSDKVSNIGRIVVFYSDRFILPYSDFNTKPPHRQPRITPEVVQRMYSFAFWMMSKYKKFRIIEVPQEGVSPSKVCTGEVLYLWNYNGDIKSPGNKFYYQGVTHNTTKVKRYRTPSICPFNDWIIFPGDFQMVWSRPYFKILCNRTDLPTAQRAFCFEGPRDPSEEVFFMAYDKRSSLVGDSEGIRYVNSKNKAQDCVHCLNKQFYEGKCATAKSGNCSFVEFLFMKTKNNKGDPSDKCGSRQSDLPPQYEACTRNKELFAVCDDMQKLDPFPACHSVRYYDPDPDRVGCGNNEHIPRMYSALKKDMPKEDFERLKFVEKGAVKPPYEECDSIKEGVGTKAQIVPFTVPESDYLRTVRYFGADKLTMTMNLRGAYPGAANITFKHGLTEPDYRYQGGKIAIARKIKEGVLSKLRAAIPGFVAEYAASTRDAYLFKAKSSAENYYKAEFSRKYQGFGSEQFHYYPRLMTKGMNDDTAEFTNALLLKYIREKLSDMVVATTDEIREQVLKSNPLLPGTTTTITRTTNTKTTPTTATNTTSPTTTINTKTTPTKTTNTTTSKTTTTTNPTPTTATNTTTPKTPTMTTNTKTTPTTPETSTKTTTTTAPERLMTTPTTTTTPELFTTRPEPSTIIATICSADSEPPCTRMIPANLANTHPPVEEKVLGDYSTVVITLIVMGLLFVLLLLHLLVRLTRKKVKY